MTTSSPISTDPIEHDALSGERHFTVAADAPGDRADRYLAVHIPTLSRSRIQALIAEGQATLNGATLGDAGYRVKPGDTLTLAVPPPAPAEPSGEKIALSIVYEDAHLVVIDKPAGLVVHPAAGHETGTLVNALIAHCGDSLSGIGGVKRPGIVHRLDKDTSGLLVVAKTDAAHAGLSEQFAAHGRDGHLQRQYTAILWGALPSATGTVDQPIARSHQNRTKMAVVPKESRMRIVLGGGTAMDDDSEELTGGRTAREAITHYTVAETFRSELKTGKPGAPLASLATVELETGRTHQIRVHMAHIGHPVLGDATYGAHFKASERRLTGPQAGALRLLGRQALHAAILGFEHPITGAELSFESPVPGDMQALIDSLRGAPPAAATKRRTSRRER